VVRAQVKFVNAKDYPDNPDAQCAVWVNERLRYHGIFWDSQGDIQAKLGDDLMPVGHNHAKSIIRRDYIEEKGNYQGLSQIIEDIFAFKRWRALTSHKKQSSPNS
jgi:hypothetical protein